MLKIILVFVLALGFSCRRVNMSDQGRSRSLPDANTKNTESPTSSEKVPDQTGDFHENQDPEQESSSVNPKNSSDHTEVPESKDSTTGQDFAEKSGETKGGVAPVDSPKKEQSGKLVQDSGPCDTGTHTLFTSNEMQSYAGSIDWCHSRGAQVFTHHINKYEFIHTELGISVRGQFWITSWNTDAYGDTCIILHDGVAVTAENCETSHPVICECNPPPD